jgi:hypothetical protein
LKLLQRDNLTCLRPMEHMFIDKLKRTSLDERDDILYTLKNRDEELKRYERMNKLKTEVMTLNTHLRQERMKMRNKIQGQ